MENINIYNLGCYGEGYCNYQEPHRHGFACDFECTTCGGVVID